MDQLDNDLGTAPGATGSQATIMWGVGEQLSVDTGQGPQPVDDIGAALQAVLDAYKASAEGEPGESGFMAAFSNGNAAHPERAMSPRDQAAAGRY